MQGTTLRSAFVLAAALMLAACTTTPAPKAAGATPVSPPKTALWVGNSFFYYNNSMHGHVGALIAAASPGAKGYRATSVTISGSGINWHDMESHFRPGGVASYSFDASNNVVFNSFDKPFDVAIMMDCSQCPIHPQLSKFFTEYTAKNSAIVRKYGAEPVFFMSWAYADKPEMTEQLAAAYVKAGANNRAKVVPGPGLREVDCQAAGAEPLRGRQAASEPGRYLPRGLHGAGFGVRPVAGGRQLLRRTSRRRGRAPAGHGLGNGAGLQAALNGPYAGTA